MEPIKSLLAQDLVARNTEVEITPEQVRTQVRRIVTSPLFAQSERLSRFLSLAVEMTLEGRMEQLKEYLVGTEVYGRPASYDPSQDSIVRTEARRLRTKLKSYYDDAGSHDPIFVYFRPGSYVPLFRHNRSEESIETMSPVADSLLAEGRGVGVAVIPFADLSGTPLSSACARGITDELTHALTHTDGLNVASTSAVAQAMASPWDVPGLLAQLGVASALEGTVREENGKLRIGIRVVYSDGFPSTAHRFETLADAHSLSSVQEQIAVAFISRARPEQSSIRKRTATAGALMLAVYPLVIRAETLLDEGSSADLQEALLKFCEAADRAPTFARPYCGIAMCQMELALRGAAPSREFITHARIATQKAVALDPEMFGSLVTLACTQALDWKWQDAANNFTKASSLGVHAATSRALSLFLIAMGQTNEGLRHLEISQRLDPFSNRQKAGRWKAFHLTRQFREAEIAYLKPLLWGPLPIESHIYMALIYAHMNRSHQALGIVEKIRPESNVRIPLQATFAEIFALCGLMLEAEGIVAEFDLLTEDSLLSSYRRALLAIALQRKEQALAFLVKALEAHEAELVWMKMEPRLDPLRDEPEFSRILRAVFAQG